MKNIKWSRFAFFPPLILGILMTVGGGWLLLTVINNTWVIDPLNPVLPDLQRAVVLGTIEPALLMQHSDWRLIGLFLLSILIVSTGLILPGMYLINKRLRERRAAQTDNDFRPASFIELVRQAIWFGAWLAFCFWLQMHRTFGVAVALLVAVFFLLVEGLLIVRKYSAETQAPPPPAPPPPTVHEQPN